MSLRQVAQGTREVRVIPANAAAVRTDPQTQRHCKCTLSRGVWIDNWTHARCDLCNLRIREYDVETPQTHSYKGEQVNG